MPNKINIPQYMGKFNYEEDIKSKLQIKGFTESEIDLILQNYQNRHLNETQKTTRRLILHFICNIILFPVVFPIGILFMIIKIVRDRLMPR